MGCNASRALLMLLLMQVGCTGARPSLRAWRVQLAVAMRSLSLAGPGGAVCHALHQILQHILPAEEVPGDQHTQLETPLGSAFPSRKQSIMTACSTISLAESLACMAGL